VLKRSNSEQDLSDFLFPARWSGGLIGYFTFKKFIILLICIFQKIFIEQPHKGCPYFKQIVIAINKTEH